MKYEDAFPVNGIPVLIEEDSRELAGPLHHVRTQWTGGGRRLLSRHQICQNLDGELPASTTVRNKFLLLIKPLSL